MNRITDDMKQIVNDIRLSFVATVNEDGSPYVSPKGTVRAVDDQHLVFVDIASPKTVKNLQRDPRVEVNCVDFLRRRGYRFRGVAEFLGKDDPMYSAAVEHLHATHGPHYPANHVIRIRVEQARPLLSPAYMFNENVKEADLRQAWIKRYGIRESEPVKAP